MNYIERARQRRIAERQRMEALRQKVLYKNAMVVPKPPKEELEEITKQAQLNAERIGQSAFKKFTAIK